MKRKLFLLLCTLLGLLSSVQGVKAQGWVGSEPAAGEYYLYNVEKSLFLTSGNWWGTHAALDADGMKLTLAKVADGIYTISTTSAFSGKYLGSDEYMDNSTAASWTFERVGDTDKYTLKNDGKYFVCNEAGIPIKSDVDPASNAGYWQLVTKSQLIDNLNNATPSNPIDASFYMTNPKVRRNWPKSIEGTDLSDNGSFNAGVAGLYNGGCSSYGQYQKEFDNYQSLTGIKKGTYKVTVKGFNRDDGEGKNSPAYLYANDQKTILKAKGDIGGDNATNATKALVDDTYLSDVVTVTVTDGNLRVGVKSDATCGWATFTQFSLRFVDPCISEVAESFTSGSEMTAGQWYKFTVETAGDYGFDVIDGVVLTADGNKLLSEATGDPLTQVESLDASTTYYIKSETAQTVTKTASPYTYTIGTAASDKEYIQPGNTVTVSYASMATTNTYASELSSEITGVTLGGEAISVTRTTKGFTFTVPEVTAGADYTLSIPADIIGYDAPRSGKNEAQVITLKTPAILDGVYFLKANSTWNGTARSTTAACGKYLARGNDHGTHATIDKYGLPIIVTTNEENVTTLQPADTKKYYYHSNPGSQNWHCWADWGASADADVAKFNITLHSGEYRIHNVSMASGTYLKYNDSAVNNSIITVYDDGNGTNSGPIINWTTETPEEHAVYLQGLKNTQAATAATAAYSSEDEDYPTLNGITTISGLDAEISENYTPNAIKAATDIASVEEKYQGTQPGADNTGEIVYSGSVEITDPGLYKFSMQAFYRAGSNEVTQEMHTNGYDFPPVALFFGNAETPLKSLYDESGHAEAVPGADPADVEYNGEYYANCMTSALKMFKDGKFHNDVWLYVSEAGTYNYGVRYQGFANANAQWFIYTPQSVSVTRYVISEAEEADYTALNAAIVAAEAKFGFEKDECAPYNNLGVFTLLNAAKEINPEEDNFKYVVKEATDALTDFEWSENDEEVNAIYGGDFTKYKTEHNAGDNRDEDYPYGWNLYNGNQNRSRIMGGTEGSSNAGLAAVSSRKALLLKFNATYGESEGYTMPLKAGKIYRITFKHGRWAEANPRPTDVVMTDPNGTSITLAPAFQATNNDCQTTTGNWETYTGYFASTTAGNYKLNLTKQGGNSQMQIAIGDIDLRTAGALPLTDVAGTTYAPGTYPSVSLSRTIKGDVINTLVLPFSMTQSQVESVFGAESRVYEVKSYNSENENITFKVCDGITANQPCLLKAANAGNTHEISNVEVVSEVASPTAEAVDGVSLVGSYEPSIFIPINNYVISGGNAYLVDQTNDVNLRRTRAYIHIAGDSGARLAIKFEDDGFTDINAIEATEAEADAPKDGKYLIDGKIVIVKNGVKYDANGKKLN